jgi:hypothetical protein
MISDDAVWNHIIFSLCNKTDVHKLLSSVLTSKYHIYIFHLWPSTTCVPPFYFSKLATQHRSPQAHKRDVRTRHQNLPGDFTIVNCVQRSPQYNVIRLTSRETKRACSEQNRYEVRWHLVSLTRQGLTRKLHQQTQTEKVGGKTYSLDSRNIHVGAEAAPQPATEIYNAWK